jgi:hypothetical protein
MNLAQKKILGALETVFLEFAADAWDAGHAIGWEHCREGNFGNDYWDDDTVNPYRNGTWQTEC